LYGERVENDDEAGDCGATEGDLIIEKISICGCWSYGKIPLEVFAESVCPDFKKIILL
jgi:hypothetical protein